RRDGAAAGAGVRPGRRPAGAGVADHRLRRGGRVMLVVALSELGRADLAGAGAKGANLGELVRAGLPVPAGFVVTTAAYAAAGGSLDLRGAARGARGDRG